MTRRYPSDWDIPVPPQEELDYMRDLVEALELTLGQLLPPAVTPDRQAALDVMGYHDYLLTPEWQETRERALELGNRRCRICHSTVDLNVHHVEYGNRGHELLSDLVVLCERCHHTFHRAGRL